MSGPIQAQSRPFSIWSHKREGLYVYLLQYCNKHAQAARQETPISWRTDHFCILFYAFSQIPSSVINLFQNSFINPIVTIVWHQWQSRDIFPYKCKIKKITRFDNICKSKTSNGFERGNLKCLTYLLISVVVIKQWNNFFLVSTQLNLRNYLCN